MPDDSAADPFPADEDFDWLEAAVAAKMPPRDRPDAKLTGVVVFAQWDADDDNYGITTYTNLPPWQAEGLARYGVRWCLDPESEFEEDE